MSPTNYRALQTVLGISILIASACIYSGYAEITKAETAASYPEIAQHYNTAAQRLPWRADLYELAGHAHYHAKEYAQASDAYQLAFERNVLSAQGWVAWGDVHYLNDDIPRAIEIWETALNQPDISNELYARLGQIAQENEQYPEATKYFQLYVLGAPENAIAHYRLGLLLTISDISAATTELLTASQLDPEFDPAAQTLRTALNLASLNTNPAEQKIIIGRGLGLVNEWVLARVVFNAAVQADAENAEAWAWLGEANQQTGKDGSAELNRALELNPTSPTVRGLRGLFFQRAGNHREALGEFQNALSLDPQNPDRFVSLGDAYLNLGDLIRALQAYQQATVLTPENATYWHRLALFCAQSNVYVTEVGVPAAQKAVVLERTANSLDTLGWLLILDARHAEAEKILNEAVTLDSRNASIHFHLGLLHLQINNTALAMEYLRTANELGSKEADALLRQFSP